MPDFTVKTEFVSRDRPDSAEVAARCLRAGGVCVLPTDTVYGFSGIVPASRGRICSIKGRDEGKPFIRLIARPEDVYQFTDLPILPEIFRLWPGALTLILPVTRGDAAGSTVAFRCPGDEWLRHVVGLVGAPIYSTSVNRSGSPVLGAVAEIRDEFGGEVDLIVDGGGAVDSAALPSTLAEVLPGSRCRILRQGSVMLPANLLV